MTARAILAELAAGAVFLVGLVALCALLYAVSP